MRRTRTKCGSAVLRGGGRQRRRAGWLHPAADHGSGRQTAEIEALVLRTDDDPFRQPPRGRSAAATPKTSIGGGKGMVRIRRFARDGRECCGRSGRVPLRHGARGRSRRDTSPCRGGKSAQPLSGAIAPALPCLAAGRAKRLAVLVSAFSAHGSPRPVHSSKNSALFTLHSSIFTFYSSLFTFHIFLSPPGACGSASTCL